MLRLRLSKCSNRLWIDNLRVTVAFLPSPILPDRPALPAHAYWYHPSRSRPSHPTGIHRLSVAAEIPGALVASSTFRRDSRAGRGGLSCVWSHHIHSASSFDFSAARSRSLILPSKSSTSVAFAAWSNTESAARNRVEAGAFWSTIIFSRVETAALEACCKRAIDCPNASRRAWR